jgi:hypothetical protein
VKKAFGLRLIAAISSGSGIMVITMRFEWDPKKAERNLKKHGVTFQEAATVFGDPLAMTFQDPDHSIEEERQLTFGQSLRRRLIVVSHTKRGDRTRIVNARLMDRNERVIYEEG